MSEPIEWVMPVKLVNFANKSMHWAAKSRLTRSIREVACNFCNVQTTKEQRKLPATVTMTRIYCGRAKEYDSDNLARAMKPVRDGIADSFGVDDKEKKGWTWIVKQERGHQDAVRVEIREAK